MRRVYMRINSCQRFLLIPFLFLILGCDTLPARINLVAVKSNGVEHIPLKLGIFPFLSTPIQGSGTGTAYSFYSAGEGSLKSATSVSKMGDNVAITPAADTDLLVTQESQIMTDMLSTDLSSYGFTLKQLPVEMQTDKNTDPNKRKGFFISMNLLNDLRSNYGIEAIALCDAFFILKYNYGASAEKRVVSAHVKIIDTKTLDVLAQVNLPYLADGFNLNDTSAGMADSIARLADLDVKNKGVSQ